MNIPLAKPCLSNDELVALKPVLDSGWLGMGATVGKFEGAVRDFIGCGHCVAVNTGTSALHLALEVVGVQGREVIVPSMTFAASVQAILAAGGIPVFAECREEDLNLDVDDAMSRVTPNTRAIIPVHYAGTPVDMDRLLSSAHARGLVVIEDAAHAFGSSFRGRMIGSFGDMTCLASTRSRRSLAVKGVPFVLAILNGRNHAAASGFSAYRRTPGTGTNRNALGSTR